MSNEVKDISVLRKRKKRRRKILKLTALLIVFAAGYALYYNRDSWIPRLEGIGTKYYSISQSKKSRENGNFPLNISDGVNYSVGNIGDSFVVLSDAYLHIYTADGGLIDTRQHAYSNPLFETEGKKALTYEQGGKKFRLDNKHKKVYEKELDESIIFARLSKDGYAAVVTSSDTYACVLTVYDDSGEEKYKILSVDRIFDVCFTENSKGCIVTSADGKEGTMVIKCSYFNFDSKEAKWTTDNIDTFIVKSYYTSEDGIFIIGDDKCMYYDNKGQMLSEYVYKDELKEYSYYDGKAALIFENSQKRQTSLVMLKGPSADAVETSFEDGLKYAWVTDNYVYVMTSKVLASYSFSGKEVNSIPVEDYYERFYKIGNYFYLLGYDKIDRIDFK